VGILFGWFMKSYTNHKKKKQLAKQLEKQNTEESETD